MCVCLRLLNIHFKIDCSLWKRALISNFFSRMHTYPHTPTPSIQYFFSHPHSNLRLYPSPSTHQLPLLYTHQKQNRTKSAPAPFKSSVPSSQASNSGPATSYVNAQVPMACSPFYMTMYTEIITRGLLDWWGAKGRGM